MSDDDSYQLECIDGGEDDDVNVEVPELLEEQAELTDQDDDAVEEEDTAEEVNTVEDDEDVENDAEEEEIEEDEVNLKQVSNYNKEIIVLRPENRRTTHICTKYEMTEIISIRATQISQHNNCMVDITGLDDPIKMAKRELMLRKCPLTIRRHVGDMRDKTTGELKSYYEYWSPNEMALAVSYTDVI